MEWERNNKPLKASFRLALLLVLLLPAACNPTGVTPTPPSPTPSSTAEPVSTPTAAYDSDPCPVSDFAWSPDKTLFAMGCQQGGIYLYDPIQWRKIKFLPTTGGRTENSSVESVAFSPDGKTLLYTMWSQIWKYDLLSGAQTILTRDKYLFQIGLDGNRILFAPDGRTFALRTVTHPENGVIIPTYGLSLWSSSGSEIFDLVSDLPNAEALWSVAFNPGGNLLAAASFDNSVWLWNPADGHLLRKLQGHTSDVYDVAFHPELNILASAGADATVRFWDPSDGHTLQILRDFKAEVHNLAFSPDGKFLAIGLADGEIQIWPLDAQGLPAGHSPLQWRIEPRPNLAFPPDSYYYPPIITRLSFGLDDSQLIGMTVSGDLIFWNTANGMVQRSIIQPTPTPFASQTPNPTEVQQLTVTPTPDPTLTPTPGPIRAATPLALPSPAEDAILPGTLGRLVKQGELQKGYLSSGTWSPDGTLLAITGTEGIWLYDANDWSVKKFLPSLIPVLSLAFDPDGRRMAYGRADGLIVVFDLKLDQSILKLEGLTPATTLEFSRDGQVLKAHFPYQLGTLSWDLKTGGPIQQQNTAGISMASSPDGRYDAYLRLSGNGESSAIAIVEKATGVIAQVIERPGGASQSEQIVFSPDGTRLAVWSEGVYWIRTTALTTFRSTDDAIALWRISPDSSFSLVRTLKTGDRPEGQNLAFSPDGKYLAAVHNNSNMEVWDADSGALLETLPVRGSTIRFKPDGSQLFVLRDPGEAQVWSMPHPKPAALIWKLDGFGGDDQVAASDQLLAASSGQQIHLWDWLSGAPSGYSFEVGDSPHSLAVNPDGKSLAAEGPGGTIQLWDVKTGRPFLNLPGHPFDLWTGENKGYVDDLAFSPDGSLLASAGSDRQVRLWRSRDGKMLAQFDSLEASHLIFSPDGKLLAGSDGEWITCIGGQCSPPHTEIEVWDVLQRSLLRTFDLAGSNIAFSPDAALLASVNGTSGLMQMFDVNDGAVRSIWKGPAGASQAFFSPDGSRLVTVNGQSLQFWDWSAGKLVGIKFFPYPIVKAGFSPDGRRLFLAYSNGIIEVWASSGSN